ncbi:MAG: hypothetical protein AAB582_03390 [Patescibacteria group bacterium]
MATNTMSAVARAAATHTRVHQTLAARAKKQDKAIAAMRAQEARLARKRTIETKRRMRRRVNQALEGITGLCATGTLPEVQSLIESIGPLRIWNRSYSGTPGGDMSDITWGYESSITLTSHAVVVEYQTWSRSAYHSQRTIDPDLVLLFFPYTETPTWRRLIENIATELPIDWEAFDFLANGDATAYISPEVLFEIIVECSDAEKLERYFLDAIGTSCSLRRAA